VLKILVDEDMPRPTLDCFYFDVYAIMLMKWKIKMEVKNYGNHRKL